MTTSFPLKRIKVVLFENIHTRAVSILEEAGFQVVHYDRLKELS